MSYLFYDLETTGLNKCFDQVLQFAAIRTDEDFNEIDRHEIFIKLNLDVIPSPQAMMVHQLDLSDIQSGSGEFDAIKKIHQLLNTPNTISLGYNTLSFDDEFLRFGFFQNFMPPYTHQYANGCSRMDIYPMLIFYHLFNPDSLNWPAAKHDKISLRLEDINQANNLFSGQAHNALVDVEITLALARRLKKEEKMWDYLSGYFKKHEDLARINKLEKIAIADQSCHLGLCIIGKLGNRNNYQAPCLNLGQHRHYKNQTIWLRLDWKPLAQVSCDDFQEHTMTLNKKAGEPPFILPMQGHYLKHLSVERSDLYQQNIAHLQQNKALFNAIRDYYLDYTYPPIDHLDIDAALYQDGFPSDLEKNWQQKFCRSLPKQWPTLSAEAPNDKRQQQALRILGRNHPQLLSTKQQQQFQDYLQTVYQPNKASQSFDYKGEPRRSLVQAQQELSEIEKEQSLTEKQRAILAQLKTYFSTLLPNV